MHQHTTHTRFRHFITFMEAVDIYSVLYAALAAYGAWKLVCRLLFESSSTSAGVVCSKTKALLTAAPVVEKECQAVIKAIVAADDHNMSEEECAEAMRKIISANHLTYKSLEREPKTLLRASRHLAQGVHGALHTRFTVSYNLYAGSIVALGTQEQREALYETQRTGELGCFAFTEKGTGVLSGAACETTATLDAKKGEFVITSPTESAAKNWISQGKHAEWAVILANLIDASGTNRGPHLFWARIASRKKSLLGGAPSAVTPLPGVSTSLVAPKTALSSLDNAIISFRDFRVPASALLSRYASLDASAGFAYNAALPSGCERMEDVLISRLLTGRICLSEYTLGVASDLTRRSWAYVEGRELWRGKKDVGKKMSEMSNVRRAFADYSRALAMLGKYAELTRERVGTALEEDRYDAMAAEGCCIAKFTCTAFAVDVVSVLRKTLGSAALFDASRLGASSFVCNATCAAEGDNTIMELKVIGDVIRRRRPLLPCGFALLATCAGRKAMSAYLALLATAFWRGKAAIKDGQLLRDLAWARAHLVIIDTWLGSGGEPAFLDSYARVLLRFPTPVAY
jgi:alkylation response protein AidB-like acyl-CoA dehydrogenase